VPVEKVNPASPVKALVVVVVATEYTPELSAVKVALR